MGFRFWVNFLTVIAILGLTIFSLVTFTDKNMDAEAENKSGNYYIFAQVLDVGKKIVKFLEDPKSIFVKNDETNEIASNVDGEVTSDDNSENVVAYGDFAGSENPESDVSPSLASASQTSPATSGKAEDKTGASAKEDKEKFDFAKEVKTLEEITNNLKDPNWRQQELPARISNTFKKYSESSADLIGNKGFFYNKTEAGHIIGWQTKSGKIYKINLP